MKGGEGLGTPFFSVITVCYNSGDGAAEAVRHLAEQDFFDYEHIIKDGGSSDGSLDRVYELASADGRIRVFSSADSGIYDAMNQAISEARGRYVFFLNCGDRFASVDVLSRVHKFVTESSDIGEDAVIYGDFVLRGERIRQPERLTAWYLYRRPLNHQSMFFGRGVFERFGDFDTAFRIRADHELTLRAFRGGVVFRRVDMIVSVYEGGGFSEKAENRELNLSELQNLRERHYTSDELKRFRFREKFLFSGVRSALRRRSPAFIRRIYRRVANFFNGG